MHHWTQKDWKREKIVLVRVEGTVSLSSYLVWTPSFLADLGGLLLVDGRTEPLSHDGSGLFSVLK